MTECAPNCGACCDPVTLTFHVDDMDGPSAPFARQHWTVTGKYDHPARLGPVYTVHCDAFDPHTRRCTAYEDRPPICSGFPYYGTPLTRERTSLDYLPSVCAFQAEVRTVLPLTVVGRG